MIVDVQARHQKRGEALKEILELEGKDLPDRHKEAQRLCNQRRELCLQQCDNAAKNFRCLAEMILKSILHQIAHNLRDRRTTVTRSFPSRSWVILNQRWRQKPGPKTFTNNSNNPESGHRTVSSERIVLQIH
jgi:hypothetical protein